VISSLNLTDTRAYTRAYTVNNPLNPLKVIILESGRFTCLLLDPSQPLILFESDRSLSLLFPILPGTKFMLDTFI
jgi:hypothetical protein